MASQLDQIEQYERGAAAIRAAAPSLRTYQSAPPAVATPAAAPASVGTRVGAAVRRVLPVAGAAGREAVNQPIRILEAGINAATTPLRTGAGVLRDAVAAAQGQPALTQGQPVAPVRLPRLFSAAASPEAAGVAPGDGAMQTPTISSPGSRTRPVRTLTPQQPSAAPAGTPGASQAFNLQAGDANTFTGGDGRTRSVPGLINAPPATAPGPTQVATLNSNAPRVQATTQRTLDGIQNATTTARQQIGAGLGGMSDQQELMRRLEISQAGFKGSPSARAAIARAILGQMSALTDATAEGQRGSNAALKQGAGFEAAANESFSRRRLDADQFNINTQEYRNESAVRQRRLERTLEGKDGTVHSLSQGGFLRRLNNEDGTPFRQAGTQQSVPSADSVLKSYTDRIAAIEQGMGTPEEKRAAADAINSDPMYASLRGGRNGAPYQDGTRLRGPDGRAYVVRNGMPEMVQ